LKKEDLTYTIRGAIFEVNRELGAGFLEKVYENALMIELKDRGLKAETQVPITVQYKNKNVGEYFADVVVENRVILELKPIENLEKIHEANC
jgi:GxxExxY protein